MKDMSQHILQCLLVSLVYYMPGAWSRSYVSLSEPMAHCSLDELVNRLTLEDLARIVSRWGLREGISPVRVLHQIENGIASSAQIHIPLPSDMGSDDELSRGFPLMPPNRPAIVLPPLIPPQLPINNFPPPPPPPNMGAGFPPFAGMGGQPPSPFHTQNNRQQVPAVVPFGILRPPPDVTVRIEDNAFDTSVSPVSVTVSPRMPITEALLQASAKFDNDNSPAEFNYYKITWGRNNHLHCFVIRTVGNLSSLRGYVWEVIVSDRTGQEIWRGVCLPTLAEVHVRPGMVITLNYVKRNDL